MLTSKRRGLSCPIRGCKHADDGHHRRKFSSTSVVTRHLAGDKHDNSRHLIDHALCQEVGIYTCSHHLCPASPKLFFPSQAALNRHNTHHHPALTAPINQQPSTTSNPSTTYTYEATQAPRLATNLTNNYPTTANISLCNLFLHSPAKTYASTDQWPADLDHTNGTYNHDPPDFRST